MQPEREEKEKKKIRRNGFSAMGLCKVKFLVFLCTHVLPITYIPQKSCLIVRIICGFELGYFWGLW
jgi:hypothetical protein